MNEHDVQYLLDRQSIRDTLHRNAVYFDEGDLSRMDEVWAEDSRRDDGEDRGGAIEGRDELVKQFARLMAKYRWTHHQLGDSVIDIDGANATSMTYVLCWHETVAGELCWGAARYHDKLRRGDDGRWLITERRMVMTGADGPVAKDGGNWLKRKSDPFGGQ